MVRSAQRGSTVVFDMDKMTSNDMWSDIEDTGMPLSKVFNFAEWRKKENYKSILKPEEDFDLPPNDKYSEGQYEMNDDFMIVVVFRGEDSEKKEVMDRIEGSDDWHKVEIV